MFSLEQLIFALAADQRMNIETCQQVEPMIRSLFEKEKSLRNSIKVRMMDNLLCFVNSLMNGSYFVRTLV